MKNRFKKFSTAILSVTMVACMFPVSALALEGSADASGGYRG